MSASLAELLGRAIRAGAKEVRLAPGRKAVRVAGGIESELGDTISAEGIDEMIDPLLTPEARMDLALGSAEWGAEVNGVGLVLLRAELKSGFTHVAASVGSAAFQADGSEADLAPDTSEDPEEIAELDIEPIDPAGESRPGVSVSMPPVLGGGPAPSGAASPATSAGLSAAQKQALSQAQKQPMLRDARGGAPAQVHPPAQTISMAPETVPTGQSVLVAQGVPAREAPGTPGREIHQLLVATLQARGSDLHLSSGVHPMIRIDGDMRPMSIRGALSSSAIEQMVWPVVPERARGEFLKRRDTDFAIEIEGYARFRANLFVDRNGMGAVFRVIPTQIVAAERLGLPPEVLRLGQLPKGLVLVTGPTGSGKSTTLASLIDYVNRSRSAHIVTIEDPIEFVFENKKCLVNQREVGTHTSSFRHALRAALREDPDVLLVGEMRDLETIAIALETAETGHLVFATLHTTSAAAAVDRIIDQFPADRQNQIRIMLAESLKAVVAQMLCRRIGGGRVAAFEVLFGVPAVAHLIREKKVFQLPSVMQTGAKLGMRLMNDSLLDLVKRGLVAPEEALSKTQDRASLVAQLRENKVDV